MKEALEKAIKDLSEKKCHDSNDALKFSQAALNLAHVYDIMKGQKAF